jgi:hypothetical protein
MCDLQFVTGLGILISGFIDLPKGISAYHFFLITHLAWFSNLTHICGLTVLRRHFHTRPIEKFIRVICTVMLAVMLLIAIVPTLAFNWANPYEGTASLPGTDAICLYNLSRSADWHRKSTENGLSDITDSEALRSGIVSVLLLVLSLISRTIKLHCPLSSQFKRIRNHIGGKNVNFIRILADRGTETSGVRAAVRRALLYSQVASSLTVRLYCDLVISTLSDVSTPSSKTISSWKSANRRK